MINSDKLEMLISKERLDKYRTAFANKICNKPIKLYKWNIRLSESFYPLLHTLEIGFRNAINNSIIMQYGDKDWLKNGSILEGKEKKTVKNVLHDKFIKKRKEYKAGKLVAELNFGFWTALLDSRYEQLWRKLIKSTFPGMMNNERNTSNVRARYHKIRKFRNRIMHYEPVWHMSYLKQMHDEIIEAIKWVSPDLLYLVDIDRFHDVYYSINNTNTQTKIRVPEVV